jgi:hypothetical protein
MTDRELMQKILSFLETNYLVMCSQFHAQKDTLADDLRKQLARPIQWQGLTDEEIAEVRHLYDGTAGWTIERFARAIEAKLKEKNT